MQDEEALNLSERLFSKVRKVQETSTISNSATELGGGEGEQVLIEGVCSAAWYRVLRRSYWIWQGIDAIELLVHGAVDAGVRGDVACSLS